LLGLHKNLALSAIYKKQFIHHIATQGILNAGEGSVQKTSSLKLCVLLQMKKVLLLQISFTKQVGTEASISVSIPVEKIKVPFSNRRWDLIEPYMTQCYLFMRHNLDIS
jgi:hypothetical protein